MGQGCLETALLAIQPAEPTMCLGSSFVDRAIAHQRQRVHRLVDGLIGTARTMRQLDTHQGDATEHPTPMCRFGIALSEPLGFGEA